MSTTFSHTFRVLVADRGDRSAAALLGAVALVVMWIAWTLLAQVTLYETSVSGRLETVASASEIQSDVGGRVVRATLVLGRDVRQGDTLAELDAQPQRLDVSRAQAAVEGLERRIAALDDQRRAEQTARDRDRDAADTQLLEAQTAMQRAVDSARFAAREQTRSNALRAQGFATASDSERVDRDARQTRVDVDVRRLAIERLTREQTTRIADRNAHLRQIESAMRDLQAQQSLAQADVARLQHEVSRRVVLAPTSGRVAVARVLTPGTVISAGERLGMLVPRGSLRVVAQYLPAAAGKIQSGQLARVRLAGFPWTQYGSMSARVERIASEPSDSTLRIELAVVGAPSNVPLQHGLPANVEIDVGRVTPARLALRELGGLATRSVAASGATP